jgi:tetratricopeptide (TPR) repeat protein
MAVDRLGEPTVWDLQTGKPAPAATAPGPIPDIRRSPDGQLLALVHRTIHRRGDVIYLVRPLSAEEIDLRRLLTQPDPAWHRAALEEAERVGQWVGAAFHLNRLLTNDPADGGFRLRRGRANAYLRRPVRALSDYYSGILLSCAGSNSTAAPYFRACSSAAFARRSYAEAAAAYSVAAYFQPLNVQLWHNLAYLRLQAGDTLGYRQACAAMLRLFGHAQDADTANTVAWTCVLAPDAVPDPAPIVELARAAVADQPANWAYLNTLGLALYRAGRFEEAVQQLDQSIKESGHGTWVDWLFLALTHQRLNHPQEARRWWAKAREALDRALDPKGRSPATSVSWTDRIEMPLFRAEAEALLGKEKTN